jgi:hypothetical protein
MPINVTHRIDEVSDEINSELDMARLALLRQSAEAAASAAQVTAGRIAAHVTAQRLRVERGEAGAVELVDIQRNMVDLNWRLAALAEGV